jgi:hypothetical protein
MSGGFSKEIDEGAKGLMFDVLQRHQYQFPIKSTVREIVSNGLDSINEKRIARTILTGEAKVEDYYVNLEGDIYKDSKFDPGYYDLNYLDPNNNNVEITYYDGGELGKDFLTIKDFGVGLGGRRLEGYFALGYSTKRLNRFALGKFGLGNKSPLSIGIPFYTVTTTHNGKRFVFNVYSHKVESVVPKVEMSGNEFVENPEFTFTNGYKCYYKQTDEPNSVEIKIAAKKHHKQMYIDAVTSQLLYFNNVKLRVVTADNNDFVQEILVKADIMFENDLIVLSNNSPYSKPHLLLNNVNYGYIDFRELELEEKLGNIGIKVDPEKVSINPSRESLIWDDTTRQTVIDKFNEVVGVAQDIVNQSLKEEDFLKWARACSSVKSGASTLFNERSEDSVLGRLAKIVDVSKMELMYSLNNDVRLSYNLFDGAFRARHVVLDSSKKGSKTLQKVEYKHSVMTAFADGCPVYVMLSNEPMSNRRNKFMLKTMHTQGFILFKPFVVPEDGQVITPDMFLEKAIDEQLLDSMKDVPKARQRVAQRLADLHNYLFNSTEWVPYESVVVPDDFKASEETDEEEEEDEVTEEARLSAEERRKLEGRIVVHTPRVITDWSQAHRMEKRYEMHKAEVPVFEFDNWNNPEIYWANDDSNVLLQFAAEITRKFENHTCEYLSNTQIQNAWEHFKETGYEVGYQNEISRLQHFKPDDAVRLIKVSKQNVKYVRDFKHVSKFFKEIKNKTITMSNKLIQWNTARLMKEGFHKLNFLKGFTPVSEHHANQYSLIKNYIDEHYRSFSSGRDRNYTDDHVEQLIAHMEKVAQLQLFVRENPDDKEAIAEMATQFFNPEAGVEINDGHAIDLQMYDMYKQLLDWVEPVQVMLNMVDPLVEGYSLTNEQEEEIRRYLQYRNVSV